MEDTTAAPPYVEPHVPLTDEPLSHLAGFLGEAGWGVEHCAGFLRVTNRSVPALNERVTVQRGAFYWSWGQPITEVHNAKEAAERVGLVLTTSAAVEDRDG